MTPRMFSAGILCAVFMTGSALPRHEEIFTQLEKSDQWVAENLSARERLQRTEANKCTAVFLAQHERHADSLTRQTEDQDEKSAIRATLFAQTLETMHACSQGLMPRDLFAMQPSS